MRILAWGIAVCLMFTLSLAANPSKVIRHDRGIDGEFVVVLKSSTPVSAVEGLAQSLAASYAVTVKQVYPYALRGFLASGLETNFEAMAGDPRIDYIEQNARVSMPPPEVSGTQSTTYGGYHWYLDRLDELVWPLPPVPPALGPDSKYNMCTEAREAVAYVIDTGIYPHTEFESRILDARDFVGAANGQPDTSSGCIAHGTWVASVLAGTHVGVAKPNIVSLRVMGCNYTAQATDFIEAVEWIAGPANNYSHLVGVVNHSGFVPTWDSNFQSYGTAVAGMVSSTGIPFFTSADNYSTDACNFSPNHRAYTRTNHWGRVFVVGGTSFDTTDYRDYRWQFWDGGAAKIGPESGSNGGPCVSIYAPAVDIYVATNTGPNNYRSGLNGTSFSSPMVAGMAVRYMQKQKNATGVTPGWQQVYDFLLDQSQTEVVNTTTAPTYWVCIEPLGASLFQPHLFDYNPMTCQTGHLGPYTFNSATNTSDARMAYWDEGNGSDCP